MSHKRLHNFASNPTLFESICNTLTEKYGEAQYNESWEDYQNKIVFTYPESLSWKTGKYVIGVTGDNRDENSVGTIDDIKNGLVDFSLRIYADEEAEQTETEEDEFFESEVSLENIEVVDDIYADTKIFITVRNNSNLPIDKVDIQVKPYTKDGQLVYDQKINGTITVIIKPGEVTASNRSLSHYSFSEADEFDIAITQYHYDGGRTVKIPESKINWQRFKVGE